MGCDGIGREGGAIAGIAVIADIARNRKTRTSPLMNDETDQGSRMIG
jgi:hypothetical protein